MKVNELRIGNYVLSNSGTDIISVVSGIQQKGDISTVDVDFLKPDGDDYGQVTLLDKIFPIPLTEEWLLKFGFRSQDGYFYKPDSHGDFELHPSNDNKTFGIAIDGYVDVRLNKFVDLIYVHELQNFWFAVTGEELTIKETGK